MLGQSWTSNQGCESQSNTTIQWHFFLKALQATHLYKVTQMKLNLEEVLKLKLRESPNDDLCQKLAPSLFTDHVWLGFVLKDLPGPAATRKVLWT